MVRMITEEDGIALWGQGFRAGWEAAMGDTPADKSDVIDLHDWSARRRIKQLRSALLPQQRSRQETTP